MQEGDGAESGVVGCAGTGGSEGDADGEEEGTARSVVLQDGAGDVRVAEGREDRYDIDTYVLDPLTGQGLYVGDDVPRVLAVRGDRLALSFPTPYPRVEIARLGP